MTDTPLPRSPTHPTTIRIGGASGFWGDSSLGAAQLVKAGQLDFLVFDYLAELTMSILAAQRMKNPDAGFALDFVTVTCREVLKDCVAKNIRIVSNAGGMNPQACARAVRALAEELGLTLKIAVIEGDDVAPQINAARQALAQDPESGHAPAGMAAFDNEPWPAKLLTANAYLGALPIKAALDAGADMVITGRCVDSAVTLGALMHSFHWGAGELDKLAQGSLAGHLIECGAQGTGGLFTDWQDVPDWAGIGYPVVECHADGSFVATKPPGTGGLVNPAVLAEQLLYEIGDPARYLLPDVTCDFTQVTLVQQGEPHRHRVRVTGARGQTPSAQYKVSATHASGWRSSMQMAIIGFDAAAKARRTGEALLERTSAMFKQLGLPDYSASHIEILGTENAFGPHGQVVTQVGQVGAVREAILRLSVRHPVKAALELFSREIAAPGTSFAPGTTGMDGGRPGVNPSICQFPMLIDKALVRMKLSLDGVDLPDLSGYGAAFGGGTPAPASSEQVPVAPDRATEPSAQTAAEPTTTLPLITIAHGRSGDKGDISNIGIIARHPALLPLIREQVTAHAVAAYLAFAVKGRVQRFDVPGIHAVNFVCEQALDGGGMASLRHDPLGKGMAQILLGLPVRVPQALLGLCRR